LKNYVRREGEGGKTGWNLPRARARRGWGVEGGFRIWADRGIRVMAPLLEDWTRGPVHGSGFDRVIVGLMMVVFNG